MTSFLKLVIGVAFSVIVSSPSAGELTLPFDGGIDGDTIRTHLNLPAPLNRVSIRILGIDTPEKGKRAKCAREAMLADKATYATKQLTANSTTMLVRNMKWDKYGGRIVGEVWINSINIGQALIAQGVAVPYDGGKKQSWCR